MFVRRSETARTLGLPRLLRFRETKQRPIAHELFADMFAADDVEIEVDRVVEVRQQIEDLMGNGDIVLPASAADLKSVHDHELDDLQRRAGNVEKKVNRRDDHQHARDLVQEKDFPASVI